MTTFSEIVKAQREYLHTQQTKEINFRINNLKKLKQLIQSHETDILQALKLDLNKSELDAYTTEIGILLKELSDTIKNTSTWAKPIRVKSPLTHFGSKSYVYKEPYGVVLVIAPWNYPFQLAIGPMIGAIAAGNCVILKPSELTPRTSKLLASIINNNFPAEYIHVVEGGVEASSGLLVEKFDYIFFTGSVAVGKIVMKAAAEYLTPVTLELGGKCPCIVHKDANIDIAAKRIVWGKYLNAGQTCIAPDYLLVHKDCKQQLLERMKLVIKEFYNQHPLENDNYTKIVSDKHFNRLTALLDNGELVIGGQSDATKQIIEPTIIDQIHWDDTIMEDEIFGPILPVITYRDIESDVIRKINARPKPLAVYVFTESTKIQNTIINTISFGGGCVNDTIYHVANPYLPFGGVGESGMGSYHGKHSFDTFSHSKSISKQTTLFDLPFRYPNYKDGLKRVKMFLK